MKRNNTTEKKEQKKQVHFILQGKGGVGKSYVASLIIQYLDQYAPVIAIDTDPVNATLSGYRRFRTQRLELLKDNRIDDRVFDELIEKIMDTQANFVVDNGASSFIPLSSYLAENEAIEGIMHSGKEVFIHTVITGGQALMDTLSGFSSLAEQMPVKAKMIVWLNSFFGPIEAKGKAFSEMQVYQKYAHRVAGIISLYHQTPATYGVDIQCMLDKKMTFVEAIQSEDFGYMASARLKKVSDNIFEQLDEVLNVKIVA